MTTHTAGKLHTVQRAGGPDLRAESGAPVGLVYSPTNAERLALCWNSYDDLMEALTRIAESPEGVYRMDPLEYAHNVIEWCQETARTALAAAKGEG